MTDEIQKSAVFNTDEKYEKHLRSSISVLEGCILRGEDVVIEGPLATRILLDFYEETLRRHLLYHGKEESKEGGSGC
jgi:hypothetical protein